MKNWAIPLIFLCLHMCAYVCVCVGGVDAHTHMHSYITPIFKVFLYTQMQSFMYRTAPCFFLKLVFLG